LSAREPVFEAPWHAQLFALTVHLNEAGYFAWPDWADRFSATLKRQGVDKDLNGGDDYFSAWLETLEAYLSETGAALPKDVVQMRDAWEQAYLSTPHGEPVALG
jgi:nitrile hydratase accessory protein|tara:strand:- start:98 stop:409 length:312 start_codon:yes stop_codon:yes gene_type:complete